MISDEVFVEIEVLRKHGFSLRKIAAEVGCAVNTVRRHLAGGEWPRYVRRARRATKLSPFVNLRHYGATDFRRNGATWNCLIRGSNGD